MGVTQQVGVAYVQETAFFSYGGNVCYLSFKCIA